MANEEVNTNKGDAAQRADMLRKMNMLRDGAATYLGRSDGPPSYGYIAADEDGVMVQPTSPRAVRWNMRGALLAVADQLWPNMSSDEQGRVVDKTLVVVNNNSYCQSTWPTTFGLPVKWCEWHNMKNIHKRVWDDEEEAE